MDADRHRQQDKNHPSIGDSLNMADKKKRTPLSVAKNDEVRALLRAKGAK